MHYLFTTATFFDPHLSSFTIRGHPSDIQNLKVVFLLLEKEGFSLKACVITEETPVTPGIFQSIYHSKVLNNLYVSDTNENAGLEYKMSVAQR